MISLESQSRLLCLQAMEHMSKVAMQAELVQRYGSSDAYFLRVWAWHQSPQLVFSVWALVQCTETDRVAKASSCRSCQFAMELSLVL